VCGCIPSHSWECKCDSRVTLLAHTFPCLCLGHEPKVKVMTTHILKCNTYLPTHPPTYIPTYLLITYLPTHLHGCTTYLLTHICLLIYMHTHPPIYIHITYPPTYLSIYPPTHPPTDLPTFIPYSLVMMCQDKYVK